MSYKSKPKIASGQVSILKTLETLKHHTLFEKELSPLLAQAVKERWTADKIYRECQSFIAAKAVMVALLEDDASKSMTAVKEILDRGVGKPVERQEIRATYQKLDDKDLDALVESRLAEAGFELTPDDDAKH